MDFIIDKLQVGDINTNCYFFGDASSAEIVVIDPGEETERIFKKIKENNYIVKYIFITHGHFDHIGGVNELKELTGAKVAVHELDAEMVGDPLKNFSALKCPNNEIKVKPDLIVKDGEIYSIGNKTFKIIFTPGHTPGGISILFENNLFSGDTLFKETVGRTDLPGSSYAAIMSSVKRLMELDDNINVYPGHGWETTIGHERNYNPFVKEA